MGVCLCLNVFTVFSSFHFCVGTVIRSDEVIKEVNANIKDAADGDKIIKNMVAGKRIAKSPAIIMFTAPYKLCEGGCNGTDEGNIILQFPLFVGKRGRDAYKRIFHRDSEKLYSKDGGMPKKVTPNRMIATTTPCVAVLVNVLPTTTPTTTEDPTTTTPPAPQCPFFPSDVCLKKKKKKSTVITDDATESPAGQIEDQKLEIPIDNSPSADALRYDNGDTTYLDSPVTEYNFYDLGYPYLSKE